MLTTPHVSLQEQLTPSRVLQLLVDGNERFRTGNRLDRDLSISGRDDSEKEHPVAIVFSGIDPRTPAELVFDVGLGDLYSIRMAGNTLGPNAIGSMEYGCVVGGAKLILVMGHTRSGLVRTTLEMTNANNGGKYSSDLVRTWGLSLIRSKSRSILLPSRNTKVLRRKSEERSWIKRHDKIFKAVFEGSWPTAL